MKYGIEAMSFYVPSLYLDIRDLAENRAIEPEKLEKGLGLHKMALPDVHEDTATFAAEALLKLIKDYQISPKDVGKIYLGTESALDAAKPTVTYALQMVEQVLEQDFGKRCFKNCDVVDMTFACIGGVDALQTGLDYVRLNPSKKAIIIASDYAKYELGSTGEYTQGGGAVAILVSSQPKLLEIRGEWGVAIESVFDFFKPRREILKTEVKNISETAPDKIEIFTDEPIFDGQYSNQCYQHRIREAYEHFSEQNSLEKPYENWYYLIFHLPYAFHGKRVFTELYSIENDLPFATPEEQKLLAKSQEYLEFINKKNEPSQRASSEIGNLYTASIFMALMSALQVSFDKGDNLEGEKIGFLSYGSGSKSKVFEGVVSSEWKSVVEKWNIFESLNNRKRIDFGTYEKLHRKQLINSINSQFKGFGLREIEKENPLSYGKRTYIYVK